MKPRILIVLLVLCTLIPSLGAQDKARIALGDINVQATTASFKLVGKGITELIAVELVKSRSIELIEREKRVELMKEMEFGLTGAAETSKAAQLGKLLLADYLAFGEAIEMGPKFLISMKLIKVESGAVVWADKLMEALTNYDYISGFFSSAILKAMAAPVAATTVAKVEQKVEKSEQAIVAFSKAVEAVDKKDVAAAKVELQTAQKLDPKNEAVAFYLSKLASGSAKFKVVPERYVPYYNPAYLGGLEKDRLFASWNMGWETYGTEDGNSKSIITTITTSNGTFGAGESRWMINMGYAIPLTPQLGVGLDMNFATWTDSVREKTLLNEFRQAGNEINSPISAIASAGYAVSPQLSLGCSLMGIYKNRSVYDVYKNGDGSPYVDTKTFSFGGALAAVIKNEPGTIAWDIIASASNEGLYFYEVVAPVASSTFKSYSAPIYVEHTLTLGFNNQTTFVALKQLNDVYYDRNLYYGRLMPCVEQWFLDWLSARLGVEGSLTLRDGSTGFGIGGTAGLTFKVWKLDFDLNYTFRQRPARTLPGVTIPESVVFVTASMNGILKD